jgi:hypothetical protein
VKSPSWGIGVPEKCRLFAGINQIIGMIADYSILDGDGFIALVNAARYEAFLGDFVGVSKQMEHFVAEMNQETLVLWGTDLNGGAWNVEFLETPSKAKAFRELSQSIEVTEGKLHLVNYMDLSMAAQFEDERIPSAHRPAQAIDLPNGKYAVTVRQMFDPETFSNLSMSNTYEVILQPTTESSPKIDAVHWWSDSWD